MSRFGLWTSHWFVLDPTKCASLAPPHTACAAPRVKRGRKFDLKGSEFATLNDRKVEIFGVPTQICVLFRTALAKSRLFKPTPCPVHPHPHEGVSFEDGQNYRDILQGHPLYTEHVFFFELDKPRPNHPRERATPFRISAILEPKG